MNFSYVHKTQITFGKLPNWYVALSRGNESTKFNPKVLISYTVVKMSQIFPLKHLEGTCYGIYTLF